MQHDIDCLTYCCRVHYVPVSPAAIVGFSFWMCGNPERRFVNWKQWTITMAESNQLSWDLYFWMVAEVLRSKGRKENIQLLTRMLQPNYKEKHQLLWSLWKILRTIWRGRFTWLLLFLATAYLARLLQFLVVMYSWTRFWRCPLNHEVVNFSETDLCWKQYFFLYYFFFIPFHGLKIAQHSIYCLTLTSSHYLLRNDNLDPSTTWNLCRWT